MEPQQTESNATKYIIGIVIVAIIIIAVSLGAKEKTSEDVNESVQPVVTNTMPAEGNTTVDEMVLVPEDTTPKAKTVEVTYTDTGFSPKEISIKLGDTVKFINKSSEGMWVGSAMHPTHIVYSGTSLSDHCPDAVGTAFDQCGSTAEYSFTFNKVGSWGYHNHVSAKMFGKVIVTEK
ncbi:MAG: plastocyanin/azurin family copper-binding protein [Patescibacteria group bacterium]